MRCSKCLGGHLTYLLTSLKSRRPQVHLGGDCPPPLPYLAPHAAMRSTLVLPTLD